MGVIIVVTYGGTLCLCDMVDMVVRYGNCTTDIVQLI